MIPSTVQWYEIPFFLAGVIGAIGTYQNIRLAWGDLQYLISENVNGWRRAVQTKSLYTQVLYFWLSLFFIAMGFSAMNTPALPLTPWRMTTYTFIYTLPLAVLLAARQYRIVRIYIAAEVKLNKNAEREQEVLDSARRSKEGE